MKKISLILSMLAMVIMVNGQGFESPQIDSVPFTKVTPFVGGAFALQFQGLKHAANNQTLVPLGDGFNLPTANFTLGANLAPGMKVVLETYLSSRHHNETWVKGGYLLIDKMPFIKWDALDQAMNFLTFKIGVMDLNYGDAHFRRTDNGYATANAFVGNYIMNAFTTAPAIEIYARPGNGLILMGGVTQCIVNQVIAGYDKNTKTYTDYKTADELSFYGKVGIDKKINDELRLRATISGFTGINHSLSLYNGDRTGSRYYLVMNQQNAGGVPGAGLDIKSPQLTGDYDPSAFGTPVKDNSVMLNLYAEFKDFEFFGTYELAKGQNSNWNKTTKDYDKTDYKFTEISVEALYHFGGEKQFYIGSRFNTVKDQMDQKINRIQGAAGWKMTKNVVAKLEYVDQKYFDFAQYNLGSAGFKGWMFEAAISF